MQFISKIALFSIILSIVCLNLPLLTSAQVIPGLQPTANLNLISNPEFPRANQKVIITAESYFIDLDRATIAWFINDVKKFEGLALKEISLTVGEVGSVTKVSAVAIEGKERVLQTITLSPAEIEIIWQADTYTPPLYKSKALYGNQANVIIQALPFIGGKNKNELIFTWTRGGQTILKGQGQDVVIVEGSDIVEPRSIIVTAESLDKKFRAQKAITLEEVFPKILFYEKSQNAGTYFNRALTGEFVPSTEEFTISAFPLGFSQKNRIDPSARIIWSVNSRQVTDNLGNPEILLRKSGEGTARVSATLQSSKKIFQIGKAELRVNLGN